MTANLAQAVALLPTFDWEPQSGGILITTLIDGEPIGSCLLMGDDHLIALEMLNNANESYPTERVLADLYGCYR
jgi:hypothetical protein